MGGLGGRGVNVLSAVPISHHGHHDPRCPDL